MKKFIILIILFIFNLFYISFGNINELNKYFSQEQINYINKRIKQFSNENYKKYKNLDIILSKFEQAENKIKKLKQKYNYKPFNLLLNYINTKLFKEKINLINTKYIINDNFASKNSIIATNENIIYGFVGFRIKALYGDILIKRLVFKNQYPDKLYFLKRIFLYDYDGNLIGDGKFIGNYVAINLYKPIVIKRKEEKAFFIRIYTQNIKHINSSNKKLKFNLVNEYNGIKTLILNKYTAEPINHFTQYIDFNTFVFRKDRLYLNNLPEHNKLNTLSNKIYSFKVKSENGYSKIYGFNLDLILNNIEINTGNYKLYINNKKYTNAKIYAINKTGKTKLKILFPSLLNIGKNYKTITIYAENIKYINDKNNYIVTNLKNNGDTLNFVNGNYTGNWAIIYTDGSYKGIENKNLNIFFTDKYLNYDLSSWVIEK